MLQFIGRDHVPNMTEMVKPLRDMIPLGKYQTTGKLIWTTESSAAFKLCQQAISNCQELIYIILCLKDQSYALLCELKFDLS